MVEAFGQEGAGRSSEVIMTNEELFYAAFSGGIGSAGAFDIGGELDDRISIILKRFNETTSSGGTVPIEDTREYYALKDAQDRCDRVYGQLTGFRRTGCSLGAPVRYRV